MLRFLRRAYRTIRPHLPFITALLLLLLLPTLAFAQAAPATTTTDVFARSCSANGQLSTLVARFYTAFIGVIIAVAGFMMATQRERTMSLVGGLMHHITESSIIGVLILAAPGIGALITTAIAGTACP